MAKQNKFGVVVPNFKKYLVLDFRGKVYFGLPTEWACEEVKSFSKVKRTDFVVVEIQ